MPQVVIENPILNSPYEEPSRHSKFSDGGITNEIVESGRMIVTPGITIHDRMRASYPNDPQNYYQQRDIVSASDLAELGWAKIIKRVQITAGNPPRSTREKS